MTALTAQQWVLIGVIAFCSVCIACALALNWAGKKDRQDMANDWWKDV